MKKLKQVRSRPATIVATSRVDARYLATLQEFWEGQGEIPKSVSELIRLSLESFAEFLILSKKATFVQTQGDALQILGGAGYHPPKVSPKNLAEALAKESGDLPLSQVLAPPDPAISHKLRTKKAPISEDSPELQAASAALSARLLQEQEKKNLKDSRTLKENLLASFKK